MPTTLKSLPALPVCLPNLFCFFSEAETFQRTSVPSAEIGRALLFLIEHRWKDILSYLQESSTNGCAWVSCCAYNAHGGKDNICLGYKGAPMTNQSATDQLAHPGWEAQKPEVFHSIIVCMGANQMVVNQGVNEEK